MKKLRVISEESFHEGMEALQRLDKYNQAKGDHFEGDML